MPATNDEILAAVTELQAKVAAMHTQVNNVQDQVATSHKQLDQMHAQMTSEFDAEIGQIKVTKDRVEIPNLNLLQDLHTKIADLQTKVGSILHAKGGPS